MILYTKYNQINFISFSPYGQGISFQHIEIYRQTSILLEVCILHRPIPIRFFFFFSVALAIAAGLLWLLLEGPESAVPAALATLIAALPIPYALACLFADRAAHKALADAGAAAEGGALDLLKDVDTVILRRSLLMTGEPHIKELAPEGMTQSALLALAASAEQEAEHPYARVICETAENRMLRLHRLAAANVVPHAGAEALLTRQALRVGRLDWLEDEGAKLSAELATRADQLATKGLAVIGVSLGRRVRGLIAFEQDLSEDAKAAIAELDRAQVKTVLFTSGSHRYGLALAKAMGIAEVKSSASPDDLARELQLRKARGSVIASLAPGFESSADLVIDIAPKGTPHLIASDTAAKAEMQTTMPKPDAETADEKSGAEPTAEPAHLRLASLSPLSSLMTATKRAASALRLGFRLSLLFFILLVLPAFGVLHAAGGPFLNPVITLLGLLLATIVTSAFVLHRA